MPSANPVVAVIREWIEKADNDLKNAAHTLKLGNEAPTDTICFHVQQCIEKYLKAFLVFQSTPFPKTHDVHELMQLLSPKSRPVLDKAAQDRITKYAVMIRYPGVGLDITLTEARKAVATARRIRREVRRLLPPAALRRK